LSPENSNINHGKVYASNSNLGISATARSNGWWCWLVVLVGGRILVSDLAELMTGIFPAVSVRTGQSPYPH
jgi:hypothetical protein